MNWRRPIRGSFNGRSGFFCGCLTPGSTKNNKRGDRSPNCRFPKKLRRRETKRFAAIRTNTGLAYQAEAPVNWCPALGTVLANEEVIGGLSERGNHPVERIFLRQWMLRITAYAERLLAGLDDLNWPESIKALQRNWIGRSEGAEVDFYIGDDIEGWKAERAQGGFPEEAGDDVLRVYTTRPDTLFGATYMVLAPEHPLVDRLTSTEQRDAVTAYRDQAATKSDLDRTDLAKRKRVSSAAATRSIRSMANGFPSGSPIMS